MLPRISHLRLRWFSRYVAFYLRRNFHRLHLAQLGSLDALSGRSVMVCLNHPSWWDPLIGVFLSQRIFSARASYGPIAAAGLEKYKFFETLGFFGIDPKTREGAERFLRVGEAVLAHANGAFWVTPQGHFTDVRERPVQLQSGVGHLARRCSNLVMLPVALEYAFWNERYPESFVAIGEPVLIGNGQERTPIEWTNLFSAALERTQDKLAQLIIARDSNAFEPLLSGSAGVGGVYDMWRALKARAQGKPFASEHGGL